MRSKPAERKREEALGGRKRRFSGYVKRGGWGDGVGILRRGVEGGRREGGTGGRV